MATGRRLTRAWRGVVWYLDGLLGGSAYAGYLAWHRRHGTGPPLAEAEYWRRRSDHQDHHPQGRCC